MLIDDIGPRDAQCAPLTIIGDGPFRPPLGDQCSPRLGIEPAWETDVRIFGPEAGPAPTTRCADALGIVPGARLPGALRVDYGPGCAPRPRVTLDVETADCRCR